MALAGARQVHIGQTEDGMFAVQRDLIVDPSTGRAATVEKVILAVPTEDGNVAIVEQQRVRVLDTGESRRNQPQAITYGNRPPNYGGAPYSGGGSADDQKVNHCAHCILTMICPCWIIIWILACCAAAAS